MPDYDYNCKNCNEIFTVNKSMSDTTIPDCPKCNSPDVKRIWGSFIVKGGNGSGSKCGSCSSGSCSTCH
ncbi:MAG: hypothetical protein ACD_20C00395G0020 [uncultured bacterium]|nr:MAG: hypothetical protein ACD_20C00395G0020 [uncultured bacterium]